MPVIHHEVSDGVLYAEPVIRVLANGTSEEISEPVVFFNVKLTD